jgi:hypothetical protein
MGPWHEWLAASWTQSYTSQFLELSRALARINSEDIIATGHTPETIGQQQATIYESR